MNFGKTLWVACAAIAALLPHVLLAQVTNPPLAPVPSYMVTPGITGPIQTYQPALPPANNGQFIVPETYGGAPVMGPSMVCPPACPPMCGPVCPQPCPPANFDPYYSPLPSSAAPVATMPGGINWNTAAAGAGITPRFGAGYLDGEHVGLTDGYIWLEGWAPLWQTPGQNVFFVDVNTLKYNDGSDQWGFNGHGGYRWFNCQTNRIWGFYLGYDYRDVGPAEFQQISGGVESLGHLWDFRANGYWVFDNDTEVISVSPPFFVGNNIAVNTTNLDAYSGFDAEVGRNFTPNNPTLALRGFLGGYGFFNSNTSEDIWGGRARLEARWWNRFTAEAGVNYDQTFDTTVWLAGSVLLGGSRAAAANCGCPPTIVDRLADPLYKNRHIVVNQRVEQELLVNPLTDQPYFVLHIDSNNAAPGAGTFEDPFATLALAEAANNANVDILLAHAGSVFNNQQITLNVADQRFLGDGGAVPHAINSQFGNFTLPRANGQFAQPVIANTANGDSVTIAANNVEVAGFTITDPEDSGILVNQVTGFNINRNTISGADNGAGGDGQGIEVDVTGIAGATGTIANNIVSGTTTNNGIQIITGAGSFSGNVTQNTSTGNNSDGFDIGNVSGGNFTGNIASGNGNDGFDFDAISGGLVAQNNATTNGADGFRIGTLSGGTFSNNTASNNNNNNYEVTTMSGGQFNANTAVNSLFLNGFAFGTASGGNISFNTALLSDDDGFVFNTISGAIVEGNVSNNSGDDGFQITTFNAGQFNNNQANNNAGNGFEAPAPAGTATAVGNTGVGNGANNTYP